MLQVEPLTVVVVVNPGKTDVTPSSAQEHDDNPASSVPWQQTCDGGLLPVLLMHAIIPAKIPKQTMVPAQFHFMTTSLGSRAVAFPRRSSPRLDERAFGPIHGDRQVGAIRQERPLTPPPDRPETDTRSTA